MDKSMPPFRIHQTRIRPERILIKLIQGKYIIPQYVAPILEQPPVPVSVPEKETESKKTTISLKQIKLILSLLQKSENKDISKLLSPELKDLLSMDEDKVDDVETMEEDFEVTEEHDKEDKEDDDDVLIIDV